MSNEKMTAKQFMDKLLAGLSVGIVVSLIPNALLGELLKVIIPHFAPVQTIFDITLLAMRLSPVVIVAGGIGVIILPYVKGITLFIGDIINRFTTLQSILI